jgi:DnaJ homolog subfamily A member 2
MAADLKGYYQVLGLTPGASVAEVRRAYAARQVKYHPDSAFIKEKMKNAKSDADREAIKKECEEVASKLNAAKSVLFDEKKKQQYDSGMDEFGGSQFAGDTDIFDIFSRFARGRGAEQPGKVKDTVYQISISLKDAYLGKSSEVYIKLNRICAKCSGRGGENVDTCKKCGGRGKVNGHRQVGGFVTMFESRCNDCNGSGSIIKGRPCDGCNGSKYVKEKVRFDVEMAPGIRKGERIVFHGMGDQLKDAVSGDVVFVVDVGDDSRFERCRNDLVSSVDIPLYAALAGGSCCFTHIDGRKLEVKFSPFKSFDATLRVYAEGFKTKEGTGNLYLKPNIIIGSEVDRKKILGCIAPPAGGFSGVSTTKTADFGQMPEPEKEHEEASDEMPHDARSFFRNFSFF